MFWLGYLAGFGTAALLVFGFLMWFAIQDLREEDAEREAYRRLEDGDGK